MNNSIKNLFFYIKEDINANGKIGMNFPLRWFLGEENARVKLYLIVFRILEYLTNAGKSPLIFWYPFFYVWHKRQSLKYGLYLHPNTIGYRLKIAHVGGIHINCLKMGNYCTVTQGVVLGKKRGNENRPIIGNNVHLLLGCKVLGKIQIGDNCWVAPNSVVIKDVPMNSVVSGVPASIIKTII